MKGLALLLVCVAFVLTGCFAYEAHENHVAECSATNTAWELRLTIYRDAGSTDGDYTPPIFAEVCAQLQEQLPKMPVR